MKLISSLSGVAAVRMNGEETSPANGLLQRDLISRIAQWYEFSVVPPDSPGGNPLLQFQSGICHMGENRIPITQLLITSDGDAISAQNTSLADRVLTDYLTHLEKEMAYRLEGVQLDRIYQSYLLVELEQKLVDKMFFDAGRLLIGEALGANSKSSYSIKRWTLGQDASNYLPSQPSLVQFLPTDFVIERRANEPFERNRFFCTAPLTTQAHIDILERMERVS